MNHDENLRIEEIFESFPEITPELMTECNSLFRPYIFYEKKENNRHCTCTACQEKWSYPQRVTTDTDVSIIEGKHNDNVVCPHCGAKAILKNMGRSKKRNSLTEEKYVVFIIPESYNRVYIRCFYTWKRYDNNISPPDIRMSETTRYYLEPGTALCWKYGYDYTHFGVGAYGWKLRKNILLSFPATTFNGYYRRKDYIGTGHIQNCFLKYSQWDTGFARDFNLEKYLCAYAKYPQIEMLVKNGYTEVVTNIVYGKKSARAVNWKASDPTGFFGLDRQELKDYSKTDKSIDTLSVYKKLKNVAPVTFAEAEEFIEKVGADNIFLMADTVKKYKLSRVKLMNYLSSRDRIISYLDYISMAEKLKYDLKNEVVLYPKNLKKAHDNAVKNYNALCNAEQVKSMEALTRKLRKKYEFRSDIFSVIVPESMNEIITEGKALNHCVGGYASRHAEGKTVILFLRLSEFPNTPMYTVEMRGTEIRQVQGKNNRTPLSAEAKSFFDDWAKWVKNGSNRDKLGAPMIDSPADMNELVPAAAISA